MSQIQICVQVLTILLELCVTIFYSASRNRPDFCVPADSFAGENLTRDLSFRLAVFQQDLCPFRLYPMVKSVSFRPIGLLLKRRSRDLLFQRSRSSIYTSVNKNIRWSNESG